MAVPKFTNNQKVSLSRLGLSRAQINELESTLLLAKAWMDAEVSPMGDVRDVLNDSRMAFNSATHMAMKLLHPKTTAQCEASFRVMDADCDAEQDGGAVMDAFHALVEAILVLDTALDALPNVQRRDQTSDAIFQRIDKALLDGFTKDAGIAIEGFPRRPYEYIQPSRHGTYRSIINIYYAAIGHGTDNPDRAIRNYITRKAEAISPHR